MIVQAGSGVQPTATVQTDLERDDLKGHVCAVTESTAELVQEHGRSIELQRFARHDTQYSNKGFRVSEVSYEDTEVRSRDAFEYLGNGEVVQETHYNPRYFDNGDGHYPYGEPTDAEGWMIGRTILRQELDANGRLSTLTEFDPKTNKAERKLTRSYDDLGRQTGETMVRLSTGIEVTRSVITYNRRGVETSADLHLRGTLHMRSTYEDYRYDSQGNWYRRTSTSQIFDPPQKFRAHEYRDIEYCGSASGASGREREPLQTGFVATTRQATVTIDTYATFRVEPTFPSGLDVVDSPGAVAVEVTIDRRGRVVAARALSGPAACLKPAIAAARKWRFRVGLPGRKSTIAGVLVFSLHPGAPPN